jgi:hypothetical protein
MNKRFEVIFLEQAIDFLDSLDLKQEKKSITMWTKQNSDLTPSYLKK